jgi:cytochrome c oxidase assembly factor CtaG
VPPQELWGITLRVVTYVHNPTGALLCFACNSFWRFLMPPAFTTLVQSHPNAFIAMLTVLTLATTRLSWMASRDPSLGLGPVRQRSTVPWKGPWIVDRGKWG